MREVKFRGKRIDNGEWAYGYIWIVPGVNLYYILTGKINIVDYTVEKYEIDPKTISQYIGIKDIHQKKVFQGHIVKVKEIVYTNCYREEIEEIREYIGEVVWHQFGWHIAENAEIEIQDEIYDATSYHPLWLWNVKDDESDPDNCFMEIVGNI